VDFQAPKELQKQKTLI